MTRPRRPGLSVQLKPADPFELVRWLARSQSDPRKAVAELVQNSLDAGAKHVSVCRQRIKGELCLVVRDDGEGVIPGMTREAALRYIATHVGHSRKLGLGPAERAQRVVAGKYGVGILGFWSIGRFFELRSRVAGSELLALRLEEDSPHAQILPLPRRIDALETMTEAIVLGVHPTAQKMLGGRRLADYLAAELRGQLLQQRAELLVQDEVARGLAQKSFVVTPRRFSGERLALPSELAAPGFAPLRIELYLARGAEEPRIQVACAGTLVADDISALDALGLAVPPWMGRELCGLIDFASFNVPPGTRRGVMPDRAAEAFVAAMEPLAALVSAELTRLDAERRAAADRDVVRDLRRALRGFQRRLPHYALPEVRGAAEAGPSADEGPPSGARIPETKPREPPGATELHLFPPGPLARVRVLPEDAQIFAGGERRLRALATDETDRPVPVAAYVWSVDGAAAGLLSLRGEGASVQVTARFDASDGEEGRVHVLARGVPEGGGTREARGLATVRVVEGEAAEAALGIPEPELVSDVDGAWRSRMAGSHWEVNAEHEDYRALRADPRGRMRYLLSLLAKEIVLRTIGRPETADALESLVEVLAHAERNLRGG
jgi:hypothetical protein